MPKETKPKGEVIRLETEKQLEAKIVRQVKAERLQNLRALTMALRSLN